MIILLIARAGPISSHYRFGLHTSRRWPREVTRRQNEARRQHICVKTGDDRDDFILMPFRTTPPP